MNTIGTRLAGLLKKYWMPLFMVGSLVYLLYYIRTQLNGIGTGISFELVPLIGSALFQALFWVVSSHLWRTALFTVSDKMLPLTNSFFQLCLGNLGKYIPGKIWGMVARASYLKQNHNIEVGRIIQATYIEQIYLLGSGVVLASIVAAVIIADAKLWFLALLITASIFAAMIYQKPISFMIDFMRRLYKSESVDKISDFRLPPKRMVMMFVLYIVAWLSLSMVMYTLYLSLFPSEISMHMAGVMVLACVAGIIAGFVAIFSPGGVGVREAVIAAILFPYMPVADAILLVLFFRIWLSALEILVGGTLYLRNRNSTA
ncbi:MAG: Uncharacterized protein FD165_2424 [Gammaproteobacteria bacterium]|nr:MAG: Uncharacterized protein FD165_2424 [Gammaproteobacteria bacterium]TND03662.1 MAG: Uncharacterized protein family (UPF0104) [Gammaproteobacteria bacterium]